MAAQIAAVLIFLVMFLLIIMDKIERHIITLGCAVVTMVVVFGICMHSMTALTETLNVAQIFTRGFWYTAGEASESSAGINWATIIFRSRYDDHGRRYGSSGIFQMALHDDRKSGKI